MNYGGVSRSEQEVTIRLDQETGEAHVCSTWPEWSRKLARMYGPPKKVMQRGDQVTSGFWVIPLASVLLRRRRPPRSQAQQEASQAAMRRLQERRSGAGGP